MEDIYKLDKKFAREGRSLLKTWLRRINLLVGMLCSLYMFSFLYSCCTPLPEEQRHEQEKAKIQKRLSSYTEVKKAAANITSEAGDELDTLKPTLSIPSKLLHIQQVLSNKLTALLPQSFQLMSTAMLSAKYPMEGRRPSEVYTNPSGTINVAFNHTRSQVSQEGLSDLKPILEQQFSHPSIEFIGSALETINQQQYITLAFVSPAADTKIYNLMAVTSLEGRLLMATFNCTVAEQEQWRPIGKQIINSLQVK